MRPVAQDLAVARPHVLDPDRGLVEPDHVPAAHVERDELVDRAVRVDDEVRAGAGFSPGGSRWTRRVPGAVEAGAVGVVLDDHVRVRQHGVRCRSGAASTRPSAAAARCRTGSSCPRCRAATTVPRRTVRGIWRTATAGAACSGSIARAHSRIAQAAPHAPARTLASERSRPSSSIDSGSGGDTFDPVTAARTGWNAFFRLSPSRVRERRRARPRSPAPSTGRRPRALRRPPQVALRRLVDASARAFSFGLDVVGEQEREQVHDLGQVLHALA